MSRFIEITGPSGKSKEDLEKRGRKEEKKQSCLSKYLAKIIHYERS